MAKLTISQIVERTGKSRSSIVRMIKKGTLSKEKNESGVTVVDESEVFRVLSPVVTDDLPAVTTLDSDAVIQAKNEHIRTLQDTVDNLTDQLEASREQQTRLAGMIAHEQTRSSGDQRQVDTLADTVKRLTAELEANRQERQRLAEMVTGGQSRVPDSQAVSEVTDRITTVNSELEDEQPAVTDGDVQMVTADDRKRSWFARVFL